MKFLKFIALLLFFFAFSGMIKAQEVRVALVDYMKVPPGAEGDYLEVEREMWKPVHQELINQGKLAGWFLYRIPYPGGTNAGYHYATVRIFNDMAQLENPGSGLGAAFEKAHPGKDGDAMFEKTIQSRDLVKTHGFASWHSFMSEDLEGPTEIIDVVYFKIPMDKWDAYQEMETKYFHPTHKAEMKAGTRAGWEGWILRRPFGASMPYTHVAVDHFKNWEQYTKPNPKGLFKEVFSGNELELRDDMFNATAKLVKLEEWRLVDFVMAPSSGGN